MEQRKAKEFLEKCLVSSAGVVKILCQVELKLWRYYDYDLLRCDTVHFGTYVGLPPNFGDICLLHDSRGRV